MKISLVGMPACGKSTIAKKCANSLVFKLIDTDLIIEKTLKMSIPEIFSLEGEDFFRKQEHEVLKKVLSLNKNAIIATGGGLPCFFNNMDLIKRNSTSIYIKTPVEILAHRVFTSKTKRPLTDNLSEIEIINKTKQMLTNREPYYLMADFVYDNSNNDVEIFVNELVSKI